MVSAVKCLSCKYEGQEKAGTMAYAYNPSPGKEEDRTPWGLLAKQSSSIGKAPVQ